jgi:putative Holliday junction resolvase
VALTRRDARMRYLAIDLGDKRTGFASGDDVVGLVQPLFVAEAHTRALQLKAAVKAIDEYGPDRIVLGLPYNMDGTEGPRAELVRAFAAELEPAVRAALGPRTKVAIDFHDERLSSFAAEERLKRTGRTHGEKKALRDALAACAILEDYLFERSRLRPLPLDDHRASESPDGPA